MTCGKQSVGLLLVLAGMWWCPSATAQPAEDNARGPSATAGAVSAQRVAFSPELRRLELRMADLPAGDYEWRIVTPGLTEHIETSADTNEPGIIYLPTPRDPAAVTAASQPAENVFFFNDLVAAEDWDLVIEFAPGARGTWKLNGRFSPLGGEIARIVTVPVDALELGENLLHIRSESLAVPSMHFRRRVNAAGGAPSQTLTVARPDWRGEVTLARHDGADKTPVISAQSIAGPAPVRHRSTVAERWWEDRATLTDSALAVGRSLLNSQVRRPGSFFDGGFNLVYDHQLKAQRMAHWLWAWGPSINLLLDLAELEPAKSAGLAEKFRAAASAAGERSLNFGMKDPQHPAFGVSAVRWEPSRATPLGWAEYISTADSLFMAGWGWMSLYHATGERVYFERMQSLVAAAERLMNAYPVIPQDWIVERSDWTPHTLDESVFGTIGFRRLFEATRSPQVAAAGRRFLDSHLEHMGREGGLLMRGWMREEDKEIWDPDIKGHAWVIEGYLDAHRLSGDEKYLELARQLADRVMRCQSAGGSWTYLFKRAGPEDPADDKGTAIWAYLFYDLFKSTKDPEHLAAGRRALGWCLRHQYRGEDPHLDGALFHQNNMAYVRRRPITILYSTTFFGLALLEELALEPEKS